MVGGPGLAPPVAERPGPAGEPGAYIGVSKPEDRPGLVYALRGHKLEMAVPVLGDSKVCHRPQMGIELGEIPAAGLTVEHVHDLHSGLLRGDVRVPGAAEGLVLLSPHRPRYYIATMEPFGEEGRRRVEKHRRMRADKEFETVECYHTLSSARLPRRGTVLLECIGNLAANELYSPRGSGGHAEVAILRGVDRLLPHCGALVIVSNEVFSGGSRYEGDTLRYLHLLDRVNRALAQRADQVCEVVCGIPVYHKGGGACAL